MLGRTNAGGIALNFKITPYATKAILLADSPRENTIGVVTGNEITSYIFSPNEPPVPTPGMLWIAVGTSSSATFNAVKKNAIQVCPMYAKYCVGTAWVDVEALSYINGAWVEWTRDIILYDNGKTDITLDTTTNVKDSGTYLAVSLGVNVSGATNDTAYARALVNLSGQKMLQVVFSNLSGEGTFDGGVYARVWDSDGKVVEGYEGTRNESSSETTITLDISALKGSYMVGAYASNSSSSYDGDVRIKSIKVLKGEGSSSGSGSSGQIVLEVKEVTPTKSVQEVTPTPGNALSMVTVNPIPDQYQDISGVTAQAGHVLDGSYFVDNTGALKEGNIPVRSSADITASGATVSVPAGYYESAVSKTVDADGNDAVIQALTVTANGTYTPPSGVDGYAPVTVNVASEEVPAVEQATPEISVNEGGLITAIATQEAGQVAAGTKRAEMQLTTQAGQEITPGTTDKTIESGRYLTGTQIIKGDSNLKAENIKKGVSIFDVAGALEASGEGSSGGLVVKTGTTTSNVIETGLSSIDYFIIQRHTIDTTGLNQCVYTASDGHISYSYCRSVSENYGVTVRTHDHVYTNTSLDFSLDGGTFTWKCSDLSAFASGKIYYWYAIGYE